MYSVIFVAKPAFLLQDGAPEYSEWGCMYVDTCLFLFSSARVFRVGFMKHMCYVLIFVLDLAPEYFRVGFVRGVYLTSE